MADRSNGAIFYPKQEEAIVVNITCPHCGNTFNAIIDRNYFDGPFDDMQGCRVQYCTMCCAECGQAEIVEISYYSSEEEQKLCQIVNVYSENVEYRGIPVYFGRVVTEDEQVL